MSAATACRARWCSSLLPLAELVGARALLMPAGGLLSWFLFELQWQEPELTAKQSVVRLLVHEATVVGEVLQEGHKYLHGSYVPPSSPLLSLPIRTYTHSGRTTAERATMGLAGIVLGVCLSSHKWPVLPAIRRLPAKHGPYFLYFLCSTRPVLPVIRGPHFLPYTTCLACHMWPVLAAVPGPSCL